MGRAVKTAKSPRADRLVRLRDLVVLGIKRGLSRRSELTEVATEEGVFAREDNQLPFGYSSVYRYLDALRFLRFDVAEQYGKDDDIVWSATAECLASYGSTNYRTNNLSEGEKQILSKSIFRSEASIQFFSCFCPTNRSPHDQKDFLGCARPLYVTRKSVKRPADQSRSKEWPSGRNVELSLDPETGSVIRRSEMEFLYTYRLWCLDLEIIDELNVKEASRYGIPERYSHVLYPLDPGLVVGPDDLLELVFELVGHRITVPRVVPIPILMYRICPKTRMSVKLFKRLLIETWQRNRNLLHLERGPGVLVEGKIVSSEQEYRDRYGNHRYYPVVDGTLRSNVAIFPMR